MEPTDVIPIHHFGPLASAIMVYGLVTPAIIAIMATAMTLWYRNAARVRRLRRRIDSQQGLVEGEIIISGSVELGAGGKKALRMEVEQEGEEWESSGNWMHAWKEVDRTLEVAPFYLKHESGARIRVEPTEEKALLVDDLEGVIWVDASRRVRYGELIPGADVVVRGYLTRGDDPEAENRGYRQAVQGWVLMPPDNGPMMFSSTSLEDHSERSARLYRGTTFCLGLLSAAACFGLFDYYLETFAGETVQGTVVAADGHLTDDRGRPFPRLALTLTSPEHDLDEVTQLVTRQYEDLLVVGAQVPMRTVPFYREATQIGRGPTIHTGLFTFLVIGVLVSGVLLLIVWVFAPRHWQVGSPVSIAYKGKLPETEAQREKSRRYED